MSISNYTQEIFLPSKGYLNPEIPEGRIIQRCMMVSDQKFLAGSNLSSESTIQELLRRTTESPENIDIGKLTLADTLYLMFKLRILSYGDKYKFTTRCPECGKKLDMSVDLSQLVVETLDPDFQKKLSVVLPRSGDTVYTRFVTNRDIADVKEEVNRRRKRTETNAEEDEFILRLASMITRIELKEVNKNGDKVLEHPLDIQLYLETLTDLDATAIRATTDSVPYGISPTVEHKCPHCKEFVDINIQFSGSFFRPKYDI